MSKEKKQTKIQKEDQKEVKALENAQVPSKFADLIKQIEQMSVLDLSELVKALEEKFGVSAAPATVSIAPAAVGSGEQEAKAEEKSVFDVELTEAGGNKIAAIKAVRAATGVGLKDAKDLVEGAPKIIKQGAAKEEAEKMKKTLEEAGAKVTLK